MQQGSGRNFHAVIRDKCNERKPLETQGEAQGFVDLIARHDEPDELAGLLAGTTPGSVI